MKKYGWCLILSGIGLLMPLTGAESYSELMDRAERLTAQRFDRNSRAFKIKSAELDEILDSEEDKEVKIKRLHEYIRSLDHHQGKNPKQDASPADAKSGKPEEAGSDEQAYRQGMCYWEGRGVPRSASRARRCFLAAARNGHQGARFMLALADLNGKAVIPDPKKAFAEFRQLYDEDFLPAGIPLGILCFEGRGTARDYAAAAEYLKNALPVKNQVPARFEPEAALGKIYYEGGHGLKADPAAALKYLKLAQDDPDSLYRLGKLYLDGRGTAADPAAAARCFRRAAEHGHPDASYEIARLLHLGTGIEKDDALALKYLQPAVERESGSPVPFLLAAEICADAKSPAADLKLALHYYRAAARNGSMEARYLCGKMILEGQGTEKDPAAALEYLKAAAGQGHADAAFLCGQIEREAKHLSESLSWYRQAADRGHLQAIRTFADMALNGIGMAPSPELGIQYLKKLAEKKDIDALEQLGGLYETGIGKVKADVKEAIRYYTPAAELGSPKAQTRLAQLYYALGQREKALHYADAAARKKHPEAILLLNQIKSSSGKKNEDRNEALQYLKNLADSGDRNATRQLGTLLFANGDFAGAEQYLSKLENENDPEILFLLGEALCRRTDGKHDFGRAFRLFSRASEAGHLKSLIALGRMYHRGDGVRQDFRRALLCYRQAADKKDPEGMFLTGNMYYNGDGVSPDYEEAYRWFRKAADLGHTLAMQYLSIMFKEGIGVPKNNIEAIKWRRKAAERPK